MLAQPGWYSDPQVPGQIRYWDGYQWTIHVAPQQSAPLHYESSANPGASVAARDAPTPSAPGSGSDSPQLATRSESTHAKIPTFGVRKFAEGLQAENEELRKVIAQYGLEDITERHTKRQELEQLVIHKQRELDALLDQETNVRRQIDHLSAQLIDMRAHVDLQELGVYGYDHPAASSLQLGSELEALRSEIKQTIKDGNATIATENFTFNNSIAKGRKFVRDMSKLLLRAYNAEAENCVKAVRAGNLSVAQKRLSTVADQIARQGTMIDLRIAPRYHSLRLRELELAARHLQAIQRERELERERKAELREQRKVEQELKREQEKLAKERAHYLATLQALQANGDLEGIERIKSQLEDVDAAIANVDYRAANVRAGHVYVISNVGAFGEGVVKIGMTRRLEPMDRVRELGDASVPFRFDVHALFFAQDAVGVEASLHRRFSERRVNKVNLRREFFRVTPEQVLEAIQQENIEVVEFAIDVAGEEYLASR